MTVAAFDNWMLLTAVCLGLLNWLLWSPKTFGLTLLASIGFLAIAVIWLCTRDDEPRRCQ